ncbi:Ku protein [Streptomyces sp. CB00455]|uniref:Ku protein n=1 Tax=Streptomyces sp. CB00455 TaxID=1703927 RepID=UPI001F5B66D8|nr:Ku protein [Streptomyces sp. CB00455]
MAAPDPIATRPYILLREALSRTSRVEVAKFAFHQRERLGLLRVVVDVLVLHGLRWPDEIREADGPAGAGGADGSGDGREGAVEAHPFRQGVRGVQVLGDLRGHLGHSGSSRWSGVRRVRVSHLGVPARSPAGIRRWRVPDGYWGRPGAGTARSSWGSRTKMPASIRR